MKKSALLVATIAAISFVGNAQNNGNGNGNGNALPNNGNVGVGTTNPTAQLHVNGKMKVDSTVTMSDTLFVESTAQVTESFRVEGATEMQDVIIYGTAWMKGLQEIDTNEFGILVAKEDGTVMRTGPGALFPVPQEPLGICDVQGGYADNPYWISEPNKLYALCSETRVGIRTDAPTRALDVRGNGFFKSGLSVGNESFFPNNPAYFEGYGTLGESRPWIRFTASDNGTDETAFLVNNDGGIYCTSVRVRLRSDIPVPDYVFGENYHLMPLSEVKEYVEKESHLPNVPSENEMRENGISVEEMQLKLLEKVEELTLYVIQLDEANEALEKKNELLQTTIEELQKNQK